MPNDLSWRGKTSKPHGRRFKLALANLALVLVAATLASAQGQLLAPPKQVRRVLILNTLEPLSSPGVAMMDQAIVAALEKSPYQIELYSENLESTLFSDEASRQRIHDLYVSKYRDRKIDVIVAVGQEPLKFMVETHDTSFRGTPVVFCGSTQEMLHQLKLDAYFTGVWGVAQPEKTLEIALRLQPSTKHVVVVGGVGAYDRELEAIVRHSLQKYESRLEFTYLVDLDMPTLLEQLKRLPSDTIVYHTSIMEDAAGAHFIDATESVPLVAGAADAPVFIVDDVDLRGGAVGGYVLSFASEGRTAGEMVVRVLNGEKPQDIPVVESANTYRFDWRALHRWGFKESNLPPGSAVLFRQPGIWESYRWYIVVGVSLLLVQALLIFGLVLQRTRRRRVEIELAVTYDRLRQAVEAGRSVGWDWDIKSGRDHWFGDLQTMFGIPSDTYSGRVEDFRRRIYPDDRELVWKAIADARHNKKPYFAEFRVVREDGAVRWIAARGKFYFAANGDAERMLGMAVDITDRRQAELAVRETEERFRLVANTAPVLIWMSGTDKMCNYFNQPWLDFTGRTLELERGHGWAEGVHSEDLAECMRTYTEAFDKREQFEMEYRLRRHDGEYRWVYDIGVPRFNEDGTFAGYIGSCIDVTDRKRAEDALSTIGRRLIEAHEEERTWIGRELHDDINQKLGLLAVELGLGPQEESPVKLAELVSHAQKRITQISMEVQDLSHRLHSSKLEYLGLAAAATSFCKDLSEKAKAEVQFRHSAVPSTMPKEVSLCLFRVLQEALQNAIKHSGVRLFHVSLRGTPYGVELTVSDQGKGFDEHEGFSGQGLGLISMRERLQMVRGVLDIKTHPGAGTTVSARVPLEAAPLRAEAG